MEIPTTPKRKRPILGRSHTAEASISPPQLSQNDLGKKAHKHHPHVPHQLKLHEKSKLLPDGFLSPAGHLRPNSTTHELGKIASRTGLATSPSPTQQHSAEDLAGDRARAVAHAARRPARAADAQRDARLAHLRNAELRDSLDALSDLANDTTRRLDLTFYAILEKAAALRDTIGGLQELAAAAGAFIAGFQGDVRGAVADVEGQVAAFAGFADQQTRINELEVRIASSKDRARALSERLDEAGRRIQRWEAREKEWQAKTTKRLRMGFWGTGCACLAVGLFLFTFRHRLFPVGNAYLDYSDTPNATRFSVEEQIHGIGREQAASITTMCNAETPTEVDSRLARFDEL